MWHSIFVETTDPKWNFMGLWINSLQTEVFVLLEAHKDVTKYRSLEQF